jgi:hypothetical protein
VARGKYRSARTEGDYYLSDRDLTGAYLDEMRVGGPARVPAAAEPDEDADPGWADDADEAAPAPARGSGTFRQRLATAIAPKPPVSRTPRATRAPARAAGGSSTSPARSRSQVVVPEGKTLQDLINNLDRTERWVSLAAAALGVAFALFLAIYFAHPQPHVKNSVNGPIVGAIIGVPSILLGGSVFIGRRALVGFLALLTGFAVLTLTGPYGLIYFGIGLWLIMRAQRYSRAAREQAGGTRSSREPRRRAGTGSTGRDAAPAKRGASTKGSGKARPATTAAKPPAASKRYTPPRGTARSGRGAGSR